MPVVNQSFPKPRTLQEALDRVEELENLLACKDKRPLWGLTRTEWSLLQFLLSRQIATKEALYTLLYGGDSNVELKIIDVFLCKIRKKLCTLGIKIETVWGRGYWIKETEKVKLRRLMEQEDGQKDPHSVAA